MAALWLAPLFAAAQQPPALDWDKVLSDPNLIANFELTYSVSVSDRSASPSENRDLLRIFGDRQALLTSWRPQYAGSLARVCRSTLDATSFNRLLQLLREKRFDRLQDDSGATYKTAAHAAGKRSWISVRIGKLRITKRNHHQRARPHPQLDELERELERIKSVAESGNARCGVEPVPARP